MMQNEGVQESNETVFNSSYWSQPVHRSIQDSERQHQDLIEFLPDAVLIQHRGVLIFANTAALMLLKASHLSQVVGRPVLDFIHKDFQDIAIGRMGLVQKGEKIPLIEQKLVCVDGSIIYVETTAASLYYDGKPALMAVMRDISSRKQAEEERSRIFNLSIDMLCVINFSDNFVELNPAWEKTLGFTREELMSMHTLDLVHPDDRASVNVATQKLRSGETVRNFENRYMCKDGTYKWVSWSSFPDFKRGLIYAVAHDISGQKQSEQMRQLLNETLEYDKLRTEFFANISHELRTPLNIIFSTIQLLELYTRDDWNKDNLGSVKNHIRSVKQNCYRLIRLINNLIDITKIDAGFLELHLQNLDIVNIIENITQSVAHYAKCKDIELSFDTDMEERLIACDPDKIERIILNLLSNAIKFTEPGGRIIVTVQNEKDSVNIIVRDTGIGIPGERLWLIFERFRQVDNIITRNHEGSGIGLSLAKSLVEMHGGTLSVKSRYGEGSEFIINLPSRLLNEVNEVAVSMESHTLKNPVEKFNTEFWDIYSIGGDK